MSNHDRNGPQPPDKDAVQDGSLTRAWRQASDERPPPELDAAIIAAARKSVQDRGAATKTVSASPRPRNRWMQWQPLAAVATVAGLAFILLQLMPRDRDVTPPIRMEESAPGQVAEDKVAPEIQRPRTAVPAPEAAAPAVTVPQATAEAEAEAAAGATAKTSRADSAAAAGNRTSMDAAEADQRKAVAPAIAGRAVSGAVPAPALERGLGNEAPPGAADRAARIAALYAAGDVTGAADALRAFRAADPDADTYLPDSLRGWARTVK